MKNIESFYPLSPMQQGMLFHSLAEPGTGIYIELASVKLKGSLNFELFQRTWQVMAERHSILRTSFVWENVKEPIQVVHQKLELPVSYLDWSGLSAEIQESELKQYLENEQMRGFDLSKAPLMKLALIRTNEQEHIFIWTYHHILLDGWSVPLLMQELIGYYSARNRGLDLQLPPERPFRDYIVWLKRQDLSASEAYWRRTLAGFIAPTPLVVSRLDRKNLAQRADFSEVENNLSAEKTIDLQNLARRNQVTLNTIIQAAWAVLLSRYSGESDILFGVTVSGRPYDLPGSEKMIGLFINTLPMRIEVKPETPLTQWLRALQANQAEFRQYEYTPLAQVQGWSQVSRNTSLFDSILVFENFPIQGLDGGGQGSLDIERGVFASHTNFPITLVATPGTNFSLKISYNGQLFDRGTIERMLGHLQVILDGMLAAADKPVGDLPMMTDAERTLILSEWSAPPASFDKSLAEQGLACIHHWFEAQAAKSPDATAVTYQEQNLTYKELNRRANILAIYLQGLGVGPETLVGIYMERNSDLLTAILGILKAGGAYVPLDPAYPADRLAFIVEDYSKNMTGQSILITQESMLSELPVSKAICLAIDSHWQEICDQAAAAAGAERLDDNPTSKVKPENLAYVIYTSGSTGKPKGVMVTHGNVTRLFKATDDWYHFNKDDVWTLFHSYAFDFSVWEIWGAFFYGGRLVVVPYLVSRSPDLFYQLLIDEKVTVLNQTPSAFRQLMQIDELDKNREQLALRYVIFGGEALELQSLRPWFERHGDQKPLIINMYGITETTVHVTYRPVYLDDLDTAPGSVIGRAIPDLEVYILDENLQPTPIGIPGELFVGGAGVARGYLNRAELTEQRFLGGLFGKSAEERFYRSGDLARYLPNGDIEYLGRSDTQVKIHGFRIELGEIESVLVKYPGIRQATVLASVDADGNKRLVGFLIPRESATEIRLADLRQYLSQVLPDYMLPAYYIFLEAFPLTTNGKIDQRALVKMSLEQKVHVAAEEMYEAPVTENEIKLARVWAQLLGVEKVGRNDNFFSLGGDSISTIQLISRAKGAGIELTYRNIFEQPLLREMAAGAGQKADPQLDQAKVSGMVPLTPIQRWFFKHNHGSAEKFNTTIMMEVKQALNANTLGQALEFILAHHDALRSSFSRVDDGWIQTIPESVAQVPFFYFDLSNADEAQRQVFIQMKTEELQSSFVLDQPPLVRLAYFDCGGSKTGRLLVIFHHLVIDGVSVRIFVEDFLSIYLQLSAGAPAALPAKTTSYPDWARRLVEYANSAAIKEEIIYWQAMAQRTEEMTMDLARLKLDFPDGSNTYGQVKDVTLYLSNLETSAIVRDIPAKYALPTHAVLLAALVRLFQREFGGRAMLVESEGHGREEIPGTVLEGVDLSRSIGWFTSIFPLLLELDGTKSTLENLRSVANQIEGVPWRGIGYGVLKFLGKDATTRADLDRIPQPEINFNYLGQFGQGGVETGDSAATPPEAPIQVVRDYFGHEQAADAARSARLYIVATVSGGQLGVRWLYSEGIQQRATVLRLAEAYLDEMRAMVAEVRGIVEEAG